MALSSSLGLRGKLLEQASLAEFNTWRVGGPAELLYFPADIEDLSYFLSTVPSTTPIHWLGLGSNVLIRDGGLTGVVIITQGALRQSSLIAPTLFRVEAGVSCAQVARASARLSLTGLEFMAGIPGTVGGALTMNAGCYGAETWQYVAEVEMISRAGERLIRPAGDFAVSYRHVQRAADEWFVAGHFKLTPGDKTRSLNFIKELLDKRNAAQPTGQPNCGSVFRNPVGDHAARLIEQCGLKGKRIGGAMISPKHANFIINEGHAKAVDIETMIVTVQETVWQQFGVRLIPEVCIMGDAASR